MEKRASGRKLTSTRQISQIMIAVEKLANISMFTSH
jgi:hypothetical protein